jgi:site-specific DNA-methyltransferase (adenine-specific)
MQRLDAEGRLHFTSRGGIRRKRYLDEMKGTLMSSSWTDIPPINSQAKERLGYDTQKPFALLERIVSASSNEGDVVLDPFCGCGTAVAAAHNLGRRWIGIDITHLAISVTRKRLRDSFPNLSYDVVGEPKDMESARALALQDRYQFQWWALALVNAMPVGGVRKKGADQGIDGIIKFIDSGRGRTGKVIVQVKSGRVSVRDIRELKAVAGERDLGLFLTLQPPTEPMLKEAVTAGFHRSPLWQRDFPRIQIITVEQLLSGESPDLPVTSARVGGFAKAPRLNNNGSQMSIAEHQKAYTA